MATKKTEQKPTSEQSFDMDEISDLLKLLKENDVTDFRLERGGERISLKRGQEKEVHHAPLALAQPTSSATGAPSATSSLNPAEQTIQAAVAPPAKPQVVTEQLAATPGLEIKSPMVGTFFTKSAPDAEPYVSVGDIVKKGDVLCIIEAMKIMNEIESEHSGRIVQVCVEDGQMAEYEETLFFIEPA